MPNYPINEKCPIPFVINRILNQRENDFLRQLGFLSHTVEHRLLQGQLPTDDLSPGIENQILEPLCESNVLTRLILPEVEQMQSFCATRFIYKTLFFMGSKSHMACSDSNPRALG